MSADWIGQIVVAGEAETPEFKSSTGTRREATRTVCGMPNQQGGQIQFDVTPDGQVVGQQLEERIIEEIGAEFWRKRSARLPDGRVDTGRRCQEASEDFFAGPELQSGYALPPFRAADPRLILIVAGVSSCLSRRSSSPAALRSRASIAGTTPEKCRHADRAGDWRLVPLRPARRAAGAVVLHRDREGDGNGPRHLYDTEANAAACPAFLGLRPEQVEIRSSVPLKPRARLTADQMRSRTEDSRVLAGKSEKPEPRHDPAPKQQEGIAYILDDPERLRELREQLTKHECKVGRQHNKRRLGLSV